MGKKYIVEIGRLERLYKAFINGNGKPNLTWLSPEVDLTPYTEPDMEQVRKEAYEEGLSDAWEAARKICTNWVLPDSVLSEIFGMDKTIDDIMKENMASEVIAKIRAYEQEKEAQIQVGDEVIPRETEYDTMIVTRLWKDDYDSDCIDAIGFDGRISSFLVSRVSKTGKHCEIAEVLQKMKETNNG